MIHGRIRAASKDYNARGRCRHHWYRMLWSGNDWQYFGNGKLPNGTYLAADRCATIYGDAQTGDIVCQHDKGGKIDNVYMVVENGEKLVVEDLPFRRRLGKLYVIVPFEEKEREFPDPRK
jgi:hypothetical protein